MARTKEHDYETPEHREQAFREAFTDGVTADDIREIMRALVKRARTGDVRAAMLVLDRCVGSGSIAEWQDRASFESGMAKAREWASLSPEEQRRRRFLESLDTLP